MPFSFAPLQAAPPAVAAPPQPPASPGSPTGVIIGGTTVPLDQAARTLTRADVSALRAKRTELSRQINSAQDRRKDVARDLERTSGPGAAGLEQRLAVLDQRILQLEQEIALNGRELAQAPLELAEGEEGVAPAERIGPFSSGQMTAISIVFIIAVLVPLVTTAAKVILRRTSVPKASPQILESAERLERMEQSLDALSIEIERISEGQRFVTQLMAPRESVKALVDKDEQPR